MLRQLLLSRPLLRRFTASSPIFRMSSASEIQRSELPTSESQLVRTDSQALKSQSLKRKATAEENGREVPNKKAKEVTSQASSSSKQPTNVTIPVVINFAPPTPDTVKIASWNVAGLRAALKKVRNPRPEYAIGAAN